MIALESTKWLPDPKGSSAGGHSAAEGEELCVQVIGKSQTGKTKNKGGWNSLTYNCKTEPQGCH